MTNQEPKQKTPSAQLADKILNVLSDNKLILAEDMSALHGKLSTGKMRSEDWRLAVEKAIDKGASQ